MANQFEQVLHARHSIRQYQPDINIDQKELESMIELAATAPTAWNLQHWKTILVQDLQQKEQLFEAINHQQQVLDCSALFIILGDLEANRNADLVYQPMVEAGQLPADAYQKLKNNIETAYQDQKTARDEAIANASLFAMQLMLVAKDHGYDTCPMGGFNRKLLIEQLRIPPRFLPVMIISIGKAITTSHPRHRIPISEKIVYGAFDR
ncbi:Nitroreductase [Seinonella peptonophila]|uniref:Nitroreductase n=1 Tax=Seinonella peptonophila TaxID=112248 RepID=A0A1M4XJ26_9BACL|nr:nitroreductase family protein [Seinonella peptonophila]SHE93410.1 Nitroreductase [Seinonella peptonophila]